MKISKSMLIVKSSSGAMKGVEQFLKNRDWFLSSTDQMKEAVLFLAQNKPSFVLISIDHPNPKIKKLPRVIAQAFPCCVMVYAEKATTASFKLLLDSGVEYKINPPITGPAIERAVNKYIRDQEQAARQQNDQKNLDPNKGGFEFSVEVKTDGQKATGPLAIKGESDSQDGSGGQQSLAQRLLAQLGQDEDHVGSDGAAISSGHGSAKNGIGYMPEGSSQSSQGPGYLGGQPGHGHGSAQSARNQSSGSVINLGQPKSKSEPDDMTPEQKAALEIGTPRGADSTAKKPGSLDIDPKTGRPRADLVIGEGKASGQSVDQERPTPEQMGDLVVPNQDKKKNPQEQSGNNQSDVMIGNSRGSQGQKKNQDTLVMGRTGVFEPDSVFVKGVNQALDDTAVKGTGVVEESLEDNSHLACIIVESVRFSGYLVAALGKDKRIDNQFVDLVRSKLAKFLKDSGEPIEDESNMQLKVKRVDFEGWALEYAQFLRKSVHKGDEVAMAFFPFADVKTKVGESAQANMVSIKTDDVQTEVPLEFNMYIYLPSNKKYVLYTPQGGIFLSEQKARLTRQGVTQMHIQKDDVQNLSKFRAQNHLNSLITDFEKKDEKKKKKAA